MNKQLIGWALSLAVALTASGNLALAAGAAAGSAAPSGAAAGSGAAPTGPAAGSGAAPTGPAAGSNAGTHVGSNEGISNPTNTTTNIPGNNNNMIRGNTLFPLNGDGIIVGGGVAMPPASGGVTAPSVGTNGRPIDAGPNPANGTTPPPTGPITPNGALTTANVPPPASANNNVAPAPATAHTQIEGRLVDLLSASQELRTATNTAPTSGAPVTPAVGESVPAGTPSSPTPAAPNVVTPKSGATSASTPGSTEATASVRTNVGDSFGTYTRRGATHAPETATPPTNSTVAGPVGTSPTGTGPSIIVGDSSKPGANATANTTPSPAFNNATITRELSAGMPAAILANNRLYILACDPKQLSSYAGQTLRISGKLSATGALIPDRVEVQQTAGAFKEIPLSSPTGTASER